MNASNPNGKMAHAKTVLVLDADVLVRMSIVQLLRDCGYRVLEAASTDEAIAILQKPGVPVDVVLSEIDIPGSINGVGFAQWVGSVRSELKILFAVSPGRTVQNVAELCGTGPKPKRSYVYHSFSEERIAHVRSPGRAKDEVDVADARDR
jgi:CheY-like chemotaxis protein